jgi:hypothetical protein
MRPNADKYGENNPQAKLSNADVRLIREAYDMKEKRIAEIDRQIESLGLERDRLRDRVSQRQLALKFDVSLNTIGRIIRLELRD